MSFHVSMGKKTLVIRYVLFAVIVVVAAMSSIEAYSWKPIVIVSIAIGFDLHYLVTKVAVKDDVIEFCYPLRVKRFVLEDVVKVLKSGWGYEITIIFKNGVKFHAIPTFTYKKAEVDQLVELLSKRSTG